MTLLESLDVKLWDVERSDLEEMIRDCERELERRKQEAQDSAMQDILNAINAYVAEFGSLEICQQKDDYEERVVINRCDTLIGHGSLISVVLV